MLIGGRARQKGLTIIELLVITVVIGIVASITIATLADALDRGRQRATMADMRTIAKAIEAYSVDNNFLPGDDHGLAGIEHVISDYYQSGVPLQDHWGNEYLYLADLSGNYTLESFGKDGVNGKDFDKAAGPDYDGDIVLFNGIFIAAAD